MMIASLDALRPVLVTGSVGLALFCSVIALAWPYLNPDPLKSRMQQALGSGGRARRRDTVVATTVKRRLLLGSEPSKMMTAIVARFNLARKLEDGATVDMLKSAGFRGRAPVITFLAMRLLMPLIILGVVAFYIFFVIKPDLPILAELAITLVSGSLGVFLPTLYVKNQIAKRQKSIRKNWPDALDLLLICVESGMSSEHAFRKVADEIGVQSRELAEELSLTTAELSFLPDRRTAYENLGRRTNLDTVKSVVSGLMQSEKYGT
ncbi:MAG: type II secretion system F family protein, partial [Pseudorhodobacter sp.]|nr:type II secretion system F family protein [Pseudorhodobacter sp.]